MWTTIFVGIQVFALSSVVGGATIRCKADNEQTWSYEEGRNGPSTWGETFPECNNKMQSPIDIKFADVTKDPNLKHLTFNNYDVPLRVFMVANTGNSVEISPNEGVGRSFSVNGQKYLLERVHFHWGSHSDVGTEHLFDSKSYDMEAHFVHRNYEGEHAIVGVLYQESPLDNTGFKAISELLPNLVFKYDNTRPISPINLAELLPTQPFQFFRYNGSMTTPACTEGVVWSVARDVLKIGPNQLNMLRSIFSVPRSEFGKHAGCNLQDNYRPVQPLNGRKVTMST